MGDFIQTLGAQHADIIVSSLPFTVFPSEIRDAILNKIHEFLNPEGYFVQFQYSLHSKKALNKRFNKTKIKFTPLNIPPAFIYTCSKV
jgi:phospholipid N-methyltransferase